MMSHSKCTFSDDISAFLKIFCDNYHMTDEHDNLLLQMFEDNIRKNRSVMTNWIKYAQWEESQKELQRYLFP